MILQSHARYRRKSAYFPFRAKTVFSGMSFSAKVTVRRVLDSHRPVHVSFYRYPSPSLWSDLPLVRPEPYFAVTRRQRVADRETIRRKFFDFSQPCAHILAIKPINEGGVECSLLRLPSRLARRPFWPDASTATPNVRLAARRRVPQRRLSWTPTRLSAQRLAVPQGPCATTWGRVDNQRHDSDKHLRCAGWQRRGASYSGNFSCPTGFRASDIAACASLCPDRASTLSLKNKLQRWCGLGRNRLSFAQLCL